MSKQENNSNIKQKIIARVNKLKDRMIEKRIVLKPEEFYGCSEEEIAALEKTIGLPIPYSYKVFLLNFGKGIDGFVMRDVEYTYDLVPSFMEDLQEYKIEDEDVPKFPPNTFFFSSRDRMQYLFFKADKSVDDPLIYHWMYTNNYFTQSSNSIFDFLEKEIELMQDSWIEQLRSIE